MSSSHDMGIAAQIGARSDAAVVPPARPRRRPINRPMPTELRRHWPIVLVCFVTAIFAWGFGFYGQSVFLAELHRVRGWPTALIASATTVYYLFGAILLTRVHSVLARLGPRAMLASGVVLLACGGILLGRSQAAWQLYAAEIVMAFGWACTSLTAISTVLALWFDRQRGLAISLALNGASAAGFTIAPALVTLSAHFGLPRAALTVSLIMLVVLIPLILIGVGGPQDALDSRPAPLAVDERPAYGAPQAVRDRHFWSVAIPFALALAAQVGFLIHAVAFLLPHLGASGTAIAVSIASIAAMLGRIGLGFVIDRLNPRYASAASFVSQAVALGAVLALPSRSAALYGGCFVFGLSVGNVITLPALMVQREFAAPTFGLVIGLSTAIGQFAFALSPTLLGALRDVFGSYGPALALCMVLDLAAAATVLGGRACSTRAAGARLSPR